MAPNITVVILLTVLLGGAMSQQPTGKEGANTVLVLELAKQSQAVATLQREVFAMKNQMAAQREANGNKESQLQEQLSLMRQETSMLKGKEHALRNTQTSMKAEDKSLRNELESLQKEVSNQAQKAQVACYFHAARGSKWKSFRGTLVYDNVMAMYGRAYNSGTGVFTAPVHGVYSFHVKFMLNCDDCTVSLSLFNGKKSMGSVYVTDWLYGESSGSFVFEMKKGQEAYVSQTYGDGGVRSSMFSGVLIKALY